MFTFNWIGIRFDCVSNWRKWGDVKGIGREISDAVRRWRRCCRHHRWRWKIMEPCNDKNIVQILLGFIFNCLIVFSHSYLLQKTNISLPWDPLYFHDLDLYSQISPPNISVHMHLAFPRSTKHEPPFKQYRSLQVCLGGPKL